MPYAPPKHRPQGWRPPAPKPTDPFYSSKYWKQVRMHVRHRDHGICALCGERGSWRVDHIIPRTEGGPDDASNLRLLCIDCDAKRHAEKGGRHD
jgi:5-methylcytosine-specific restriction endonuclease McrA